MVIESVEIESGDGHQLRLQTLAAMNQKYLNSSRQEEELLGPRTQPRGLDLQNLEQHIEIGSHRDRAMLSNGSFGNTELAGIAHDVLHWNTIDLPLPQKIHHVFLRPSRLSQSFLIIVGFLMVTTIFYQLTLSKSKHQYPHKHDDGMSHSRDHLLSTILEEVLEIKRSCGNINKRLEQSNY